MTVQTEYIASSCNRYSNVSDVRSSDGLTLFGSSHLISTWFSSDQNSKPVQVTLSGHQAEVTTLKYASDRTFISGDTTGTVRVWSQDPITTLWKTVAILSEHTQSISALASIELELNDYLIVTGSSDGFIRVWRIMIQENIQVIPRLVQSFQIGGKIPLELAMTFLPGNCSVILAIGCTENRIPIYSASVKDNIFSKSLSLEGHSDWIRSLSFFTPLPLTPLSPSVRYAYDIAPGEILLASGSQDHYIRLWRFSRLSSEADQIKTATQPDGLEGLDELERTLAEVGGEEGELRVKAHDFALPNDGVFSCSAEAVLLGHDAWITGLHWAPRSTYSHSPSSSSSAPVTLQLLSSSADRSLILWTPSTFSISSKDSIWTNTKRFGEFASVTNLGFFGGLWGREGRVVMAHGWGGSWHIWERQSTSGEVSLEAEEWEPKVAVGGHFEAVKSLAWDANGDYLLSAGADMTTRLHALWKRKGVDGQEIETWHELGRPQIHGYPIASIAFTDRLQFVSGADEKIVRVFDAPKVFLQSLKVLSRVEGLGDEQSRPMAANVPPLGLSNRAIATPADVVQAVAPTSNDPFSAAIVPVDFNIATHPPFEEQLLGSTLWPEIEKLYGHGYEISALAPCTAHSLIATACKATTAEHAVIRLFSTKTWKGVGKVLEGHSLTITSLKFSEGARWLVSVSRDRSWRVWERCIGDELYRFHSMSKGHARIIWDVCWSEDATFFVTASRDKTAKIWSADSATSSWNAESSLKFDEAATAVATRIVITPAISFHLLAVGLENGHIHLFTAVIDQKPREWTFLRIIDSTIAHVLSVTSLAFSPGVTDLEEGIRLASASEDKSVRILQIKL